MVPLSCFTLFSYEEFRNKIVAKKISLLLSFLRSLALIIAVSRTALFLLSPELSQVFSLAILSIIAVTSYKIRPEGESQRGQNQDPHPE